MKNIFKYILIGTVIISSTACKKYLDVNNNPNSPTTSTPDLVLPQALVASGAMQNSYNLSLADQGGQRANAGGFGGFGSVVTYQYTNGDFEGLWILGYGNAKDYQYIINQTVAKPEMANYQAIARIMKSWDFVKLVDNFNDVPYSEAFKGADLNFTPKYDKAEDVYKSLVSDLTLAVKIINDAKATEAATPKSINKVVSSSDPVFAGNMDKWITFANTLRLKLLIKMAGVPALSAYATTEFAKLSTATSAYVTEDVVVQPGFSAASGRRNPTYNSLAYLSDGTRPNTSRIATKWILSFYGGVGAKTIDNYRGKAIYQNALTSVSNVISNQLGDESSGVPSAPGTASVWYSGGTFNSAGTYVQVSSQANEDAIGVAKHSSQSQPIMLAAESKLLQAEAVVRGYLAVTDGASTLFRSGIFNSFNYLYKNAKGAVDASKNFLWQIPDAVNGGTKTDQTRSVSGDVDDYIATNAANPLVDFTAAVTPAQKLEAIITQKYIALNMIANDEALAEFRRTTYPTIVNGSLTPTSTFASRQSTSPRADKLTTRTLYPQSEFNLNPSNVPTGISQFTSRIFWDLN